MAEIRVVNLSPRAETVEVLARSHDCYDCLFREIFFNPVELYETSEFVMIDVNHEHTLEFRRKESGKELEVKVHRFGERGIYSLVLVDDDTGPLPTSPASAILQSPPNSPCPDTFLPTDPDSVAIYFTVDKKPYTESGPHTMPIFFAALIIILSTIAYFVCLLCRS